MHNNKTLVLAVLSFGSEFSGSRQRSTKSVTCDTFVYVVSTCFECSTSPKKVRKVLVGSVDHVFSEGYAGVPVDDSALLHSPPTAVLVEMNSGSFPGQ